MAVMESKTLPSAQEAVALIEAAAAKHKDKKEPVVRVIEEITTGQCPRQGDLYIVRLSRNKDGSFTAPMKRGEAVLQCGKKWEGKQLAPGTNGGSRHIAASECEIFESKTSSNVALFGPIIQAFKALKIEHPQHDHLHLPPGDYCVVYQMDDRTLQRVQD